MDELDPVEVDTLQELREKRDEFSLLGGRQLRPMPGEHALGHLGEIEAFVGGLLHALFLDGFREC